VVLVNMREVDAIRDVGVDESDAFLQPERSAPSL
jgi:hypothetical protein